MKRLVQGLGVAILLIVSALAGLLMYFNVTMKPVPGGLVTDSITAAHDSFVNFFLIKTSSGWIAIDSGNSPESAVSAMKKIGVDPTSVKHVFLTHADADHAGGIDAFREAKIYMPAEEKQMIDGRTKRVFMGIFGKYGKLDTSRFTYIADGERITVETRIIEARLVPGHTPGHTAYLVDNTALFLGDAAVVDRNKTLVTLPWFINNDTVLARTSLKKILETTTSAKWLLTAHGGVIAR